MLLTHCIFYRITSNVDIIVTAYNQAYLSLDSYTALPLTELGLVYYIISYWPSSLHTQLAIVATEHSTRVRIEFKKNPVYITLNGVSLNRTSDIVMRQYESLQIQVNDRFIA